MTSATGGVGLPPNLRPRANMRPLPRRPRRELLSAGPAHEPFPGDEPSARAEAHLGAAIGQGAEDL